MLKLPTSKVMGASTLDWQRTSYAQTVAAPSMNASTPQRSWWRHHGSALIMCKTLDTEQNRSHASVGVFELLVRSKRYLFTKDRSRARFSSPQARAATTEFPIYVCMRRIGASALLLLCRTGGRSRRSQFKDARSIVKLQLVCIMELHPHLGESRICMTRMTRGSPLLAS